MNIKYAIVKNEMPASSTEAKYLGKIIPNGVRNRSQMTALALKSEHFAEATFAAVIDAAVDITQELCAEGHDVDWGTVKFLSKMHGSLPYEDSSFSDGTASLTLDADATNVTRTVLDTLTPVKISAAAIDSLIKVSNIMDVTTETFGTVIGSTPFVVLGNGITLDGEGEYVKALDKKTLEVKGTATVQSVSKGQRAYAKFSPQLTGGDYTFEIATKGLIGETTPRIFRKPVTAVYVPPVDPTYPITTDDDKVTFTDPAAKNLFGNALDCTFTVTKGLTEIDPTYAKTHTTLSKSLTDPSGDPECTDVSYDSTLEKYMISFGRHDAALGDKRYVHFGYAAGKTVVLPVTVTDEE